MRPQFYQVHSIVYSIHGEGAKMGLPCIILRLAGCNHRYNPCSWCDTKDALEPDSGTTKDIDNVLSELQKYPAKNVLLTGGEPLAQNILPLLDALHEQTYSIVVETNGSYAIPLENSRFSYFAFWSMDVKCPSSGNEQWNCLENMRILGPTDEVKFVVRDRVDFDYALRVLRAYPTDAQVLFSPVWKAGLQYGTLIRWIMWEYPAGKLSLQMHKILRVA